MTDRWAHDAAMVYVNEDDGSFVADAASEDDAAKLVDWHNAALARPEPIDARELIVGLLGEVGFMRSCIASGEKLNPDDLARQDAVMARAAEYARLEAER